MKKLTALLLCAALVYSGIALAQTLTGTAKGYGGDVTATVTVEDGKIVAVEVLGPDETDGVGTLALEQLPAKIVEAGSTEIDAISGATITSEAIFEAVNIALGPDGIPVIVIEGEQSEVPVEPGTTTEPAMPAQPGEPGEPATPAQPAIPGEKEKPGKLIVTGGAYLGFGLSNSGRIGPGKDDKEAQVYSINQVYASAIFDAEGRILYAFVDQLEVATPNYDGASMPHFSGFPGQGGYNLDSNHDAKVDSISEVTDDTFMAEIASWLTKRQRGVDYVMGTGIWSSQMDKYQEIFTGKTVEEVEAWFVKYSSDRNGRALKADSTNEADAAKYNALADEDKTMLADVTTAATMSLRDAHGDILAALRNAYDNRLPLNVESASGIGFGIVNGGRIGPGKDDKEVQVYSVNEVYTVTLFDAEGRIAKLHADQLEIATPNYDGASMPHFSGFPGQTAYNLDSDHDAKIDSKAEVTDDTFMAEIASWLTKRQRGADYVMGTGVWSTQMDKYQEIFVGMTVDEAEAWFTKYCSDRNGRALKAGSTNELDAAKYNALSDDEKAMLADVTTAATMSLRDGHGDILAAIRASFTNMIAIELTVEK